MIRRRAAFLAQYQDAAYARRYEELVRKVERAEREKTPRRTGLADAVARGLFKRMAIKDEYEVARLWAETDFLSKVREQVEGDYRFRFHLAPPAFAARDPVSGRLQKRAYGQWMLPVFRILAKGRRLRGTALDFFGRTAERRMERRLLAEYEALVTELVEGLTPENHADAVELARLTLQIRGFGHVLEANRVRVKEEEAALLARFRSPPPPQALAAE